MALNTQVKGLLAEMNGDKYVEKSTTLDSMNGRQCWLMYEFASVIYSSVKLHNLGPYFKQGMEVGGSGR